MRKKKEPLDSTPAKKSNLRSTWLTVTGWITFILWIFLAASVITKMYSSMGLVSHFVAKHGYTLFIPSILSTEAILEVAKTIGVGSLFVAWIYAELGKHELGKRYVELLHVFCGGYHLRTISHILAVLACIWLAVSGILESAGFALLIAMVGLWDQAVVLVRFIFNADRRKDLAIAQWRRTFKLSQTQQDDSQMICLSDLYMLEDVISVRDNCFENLCDCLAGAILKHIRNYPSANTRRSKEESTIISISHIWERLLESRTENEQSMLLFKLMSQFETNCGETERYFICSGYLLWLCRHYAKEAADSCQKDGDVLGMVLSDISHINHKTDDQGSRMGTCLDTLYILLAWMHFLCNDIVLHQELLESFMLHDCNRPVCGEEAKKCARVFIMCQFEEVICEKYFENAWDQITSSPSEPKASQSR